MAWALLRPTPSSDVAMVCASALLTLTGVAAKAGNAMARQSASAQKVCLIMSVLPGGWIAPAVRRVETGCRRRAAATVRQRSTRMWADADVTCGERPIGRLLHWAIAHSQEVSMDASKARAFIGKIWDDEVVPRITDYIRIPNKSPMFDKDWVAHGHMDAAVALMEKWARAKLESLPGSTLEVVRLPNRTPLIFIDVPASGSEARADDCVLLYGHLDKQPEMTGWSEGLGPWTPVLKGDRLYGRGGADDGYAIFGSLSALLALHEQGVPHARCVVMIEACEESGSYDLPHYVDHLAPRIGQPSLVVCLDSGCANYDQLWLTTSLRGMTGGELTVEVLSEGVHSGDASGVVPDSFRIMRDLLSRQEDSATGAIVPRELYVDVPAQRVEQAKQCAAILGDEVFSKFPWKDGMQPVSKDRVELILNRTWRPQLAVTGVAGLPPLESAGNVLRPLTSLKLSLRVPPTANGSKAGEFVKRLLEKDPP